MEGTELTVIEPNGNTPSAMYRVATDVAGICSDIVQRTAKKIQSKKYVCVEGWQAIATAHGCMLSIESVVEDAEGSVTAIAAVRRMSDGAALAKAEGFVGMDEATWRNRARYARRAMAQTRAMSRAARSAFAHVVVLIDSGLSTTPYEEIPHEDEPAAVPSKTNNTKPAVPLGSPDDVADVKDMLKLIVLPDGMVEKWFKSAGVTRWEDMPADKIKKCVKYLEDRLPAATAK
jgi:hypothetical protein